MLALALERLNQTNLRPDDVRIFVDVKAAGENWRDEFSYVVREFFPAAFLFAAADRPDVPSGCWNILESIKQGWKSGAELVFLIEEDILIEPDFFNWHYEQQLSGKYLATCGRKDRGHFAEYGPLYTNPGACLSRPLLDRLIPHINLDYFTRLRGYLDDYFGPWESQSDLDDGLIRRCAIKAGGLCAYPEVPKCRHIGWHFYRNLDIYANEGEIKQRIAGLRQMMTKIKRTDRYARDFEE